MCTTGEEVGRDVHRLNAELYRALREEDVDQAKVIQLCEGTDEQGLHIMTIHDDTVLQAATYSGQTALALSLLSTLPCEHLDKLTRQNHDGNTILHDAAASNKSIEVAKKALKKAPGLLSMRNYLGETALFLAARYGKQQMFKFLVGKIRHYPEANKQLFLHRSDKTTILHMAILGQHFDLALQIVEGFKHLVNERDADGMTGLQLLSCNPGAFRREAPKNEFLELIFSFARSVEAEKLEERYKSALELAKLLIRRDTSWAATYRGIDQSKPRLHRYGSTTPIVEPLNSSLCQGEGETETPLFLATKSGCVEIAKEILEIYPQAVEHIDDKGRNILHVAIKYRQLEIFDLIAARAEMKKLVRKIDNEGNSILHTVGLKMQDYVPEKMLAGPAFELQHELHLFEHVKEHLPPHLIDHRNNEKQTAEGSFDTTHKVLRKTSAEWLKRTSEGCSVVAVLFATVAFAAAYTVPGGPNNQTGFPVLQKHPFFLVFTVTDVLSLSFALTSVVIFLSILTSPFQLPDFRNSLPNKLLVGFTFLFLSVSMMMVSFAATVLLMLRAGESWRKILLYALSFLPVGIFAFSYCPLYRLPTYKFWLEGARQAIPWSCCIGPVLSRLSNLFSYFKRSPASPETNNCSV